MAHHHGVNMTLSKREQKAKKIQGPIKPTHKTRSTHKQNWARAKNVSEKAKANTPLGKKIRAMLYDMTKDTKYKERNFKKLDSAGKHYTPTEIRSSLSLAKTKATSNAKKQYERLVKIQKKKGIKKTTFKDFKKANPHLVNPLTGFDSADIEAFYDS